MLIINTNDDGYLRLSEKSTGLRCIVEAAGFLLNLAPQSATSSPSPLIWVSHTDIRGDILAWTCFWRSPLLGLWLPTRRINLGLLLWCIGADRRRVAPLT